MAIDIQMVKDLYFTMDESVPYSLKCGKTILINPILVKDAIAFTNSYSVLDIDKNSFGTVEEIQMSYLEYLWKVALKEPLRKGQFGIVLALCLDIKYPFMRATNGVELVSMSFDDESQKFREDFCIDAQEFDDIKRIILYQNLIDYDDGYIDPEFKESMKEYDALKNMGYEMPSFERRMGIIAAHSGILKEAQKQMTMRFHSILFNEVKDEVDYQAMKGISCFGGKSEEIQWIFKRKKGKFDDYTTSIEEFNKSMGGDGYVPSKTV